MKPKTREEQKQSSRLYLRSKDHREVILNDKYHNAIWLKSSAQDPAVDGLVWVKYPKNELLSYNRPFLGWMDPDRQFGYGIGVGGGQRNGRLFRFNDFCVMYDIYSSVSDHKCYITRDGITWKDITSKLTGIIGTNGLASTIYFGSDSLADFWADDYWHGGGDKKHIVITRFEYDEEEDDWTVTRTSYTLNSDYINWSTQIYYMGTVDDGVILGVNTGSGSSYQLFIYQVDRDGTTTRISADVPTIEAAPTFQNGNPLTFTKQGSRLFIASCVRYTADAWANSSSIVWALMSMDGGATWEKQAIFGGSNLSDGNYNQSYNRVELFQRGGVVYLLFGQASDKDGSGWHSVHLYSTLTGTQWDEVALPNWLDIPIINEASGQGVDPAGYDTLRVAIDPAQTADQNYNLFDFLSSSTNPQSMDESHNNILFQDGEMPPLIDSEFYMTIGAGNVHLFFDNEHMAISSRAFAWISKAYDAEVQGADTVQEYDYVL